jgi:phosphatidylserine decarboxylase
MAVSRHAIISPEGTPFIIVTTLVVAILNYFYGAYATPLWLLVVFVIWLYRDPVRKVPALPLGIVSPVDGKIVAAEQHPDPYLGRDANLVRIEMSPTSVFSIRGVIEGKIVQQWLDQESGAKHDVAHAIHIETDEKDDVIVVLRPGRVFKRLSCDANIGERVGQGHRCGIIPFGSVIDVYLPVTSHINVTIGQSVTSGETVLADIIK